MPQRTVDPNNATDVKNRFKEYYAYFWSQPLQTGSFEIDTITGFSKVASPSANQPVPNENTYQWDIDYTYKGDSTGSDSRRFYYKSTGDYADHSSMPTGSEWGRFGMSLFDFDPSTPQLRVQHYFSNEKTAYTIYWLSESGNYQLTLYNQDGTVESTTSYDDEQSAIDAGNAWVEENINPTVLKADTSLTLKQLYDNTQSGSEQTPFKTFEIYGDTEWQSNNEKLFLDDKDFYQVGTLESGGVLLEVKENAWVTLKIQTQDSGYFDTLQAGMSLDNDFQAVDLTAGDPSFSVTLREGGILAWDIDGNWGLSALGDFYLSTGITALNPLDPVNDESEITKINWGFGSVTDNDKPSPATVTPSTDPFSPFDNLDAPFEEGDGLITRLLNTFSFSINATGRAIEAIIEGAMLALPAILIIASAVVITKIVVKLTEKGAVKIISLTQKTAKGIEINIDPLITEGVLE